MKVKRMIKSDVDTFKVGDIIKVKLTDGVKVQAMAMQQEEDGMIFCLVDCLPGEYPMNSTRTNEGGYEESDLRKKLNGEILNLFPAELTDMMAPFDNGDLLRLPTEKEIFGENYYGEYESPYVKQWKPMKKRRNRMAFDGTKEENLQWYWLMNKVRESAALFALVDYLGDASIVNASCYRVVYHANTLEQLSHIRRTGNEIVRAVFVVTAEYTIKDIMDIALFVKNSPDIDELSFRQLVDDNYEEQHYLEEYLRMGHKKLWWYIEQSDYNLYYAENQVSTRYRDFEKEVQV